MTAWEPSPAMSRAAQLLAQCWSQTAVAEQTGIALRSIARWWTEVPEFREYVRDIQRGYAEGYNEEFALLVAEALIIERQALRGEIPASDDRARLAHDILSRTAFRIATIQAGVVNRGPAIGPDTAAQLKQLRDASPGA